MIHLKVLDDFISNENSLIKILYKPHPWKDKHKDEKNFFEYNFKNIIMDPFSIDNYEAIFKNKYFNLDLINQNNNIIVLKSIDALITPVSTILLEAAFLGKPIAVYLSNDNLDLKSHFNIASQRIQYTEFYSLIEPLLCESMDDIWPTIKKLLKLSDDMNYCNELKNKIQKCNFFNELPYSDLLENTINELTNEKK
jgi:Putative glycosyl/glycerophosphate transferases involved in teichoic acid biosynthesis TagF/TagB/EpsJ/RodC